MTVHRNMGNRICELRPEPFTQLIDPCAFPTKITQSSYTGRAEPNDGCHVFSPRPYAAFMPRAEYKRL